MTIHMNLCLSIRFFNLKLTVSNEKNCQSSGIEWKYVSDIQHNISLKKVAGSDEPEKHVKTAEAAF